MKGIHVVDGRTARLASVATHLPLWGTESSRQAGPDEDALTLAVAAGRAAMGAAPTVSIERVVLITRDLPVLEGGSTAVLLAGLGLSHTVQASQVLGSAAAALDALTSAASGTLVIGSDAVSPAGSAAAVVGTDGAVLDSSCRFDASLPVRVRDALGSATEYDDARLLRDRGIATSIDRLALDGPPTAVAGLAPRAAVSIAKDGPVAPVTGASAPLFVLAALLNDHRSGTLVAVDQASVSAARLTADPALHSTVVVASAPTPEVLPKREVPSDAALAIALPAYERAFDAKLGLKGGRCPKCGTIDMPPRRQCLACGHLLERGADHDLVSLPREATVYTAVTVQVPVPGLITPYSLAIVELDGTPAEGGGTRILVHVTDHQPGDIAIKDRGQLVFRLIAIRSGVPDYGYAFVPDKKSAADAGTEEMAR